MLQKATWSFDNSFLVVQRLLLSMSPSNLAFDPSLIWIQVHDLPMDWCKEAIVRGIVSFVGLVTEVVKFSLANSTMRSVRVRVKFDLSRALVPSVWIPFNSVYVWVELKYKHLHTFCGKITYQSKSCEFPNDPCIGFGGKYALFGEWLRSNMNMKVPKHVKEGGLKKK